MFSMKKQINNIKKIVLISIVSIFAPSIIIFSYSFFAIYKNVKNTCMRARNEYHEDCTGSLIKLIQSDKSTLRQKSSAIWALGQLADKKALSLLYELDKSLPWQKKCPLDTCLSKYEVQKAIKWCEQGNITRWMYSTF